MNRRLAVIPRRRKPRRKPAQRVTLAKLWPSVRLRRRAWRVLRRAPRSAQALVAFLCIAVLWFALNWTYQVIRKPSELLFPVSGTLNKTPAETWAQYGPLFERYSTGIITPELLAALAQVEGSGNPVAQTYWRWSWKPAPFDVYRPASSAVGMYQITDGTFAESKRYCIHRHTVVDSCWFNGLYTRVVPAHAVELTSAYLDRSVAAALARDRRTSATPQQLQELAAVIHLCGAGAGNAYVRRGMRLNEGQRCGDHLARDYVGRVTSAMRIFAAMP